VITRKHLNEAAQYIAAASIEYQYFGRKTLIGILTGLVEVMYEADEGRKLDRARFLSAVVSNESNMRRLKYEVR